MPNQDERKAKAQRIRSCRLALKMNQRELARKVGITVAMVSKYENGQSVYEMSAAIESKLVKALKTNERWLNTGRGNNAPEDAMTEEEIKHVDILREMSEEKRQQVLEFAQYLRDKNQEQNDE